VNDRPGAGRDNVAMLARMLAKKAPPPGERCDFCSTPLGSEHSHLVELTARRILCSCRPCYIVFQPAGAAQGKYRVVPSRYLAIADFSIADEKWDSLQVPIGLAFFFYNSVEGRMVAFYPSPAGATESMMPLDTWQTIVDEFPALASLAPDVEAVVVQRNAHGSRCFIVPIDSAYELVGMIRSTWKGFDGGEAAHHRIESYFADVLERSTGKVTARRS
jgi:hypothetical protein